MGGGARPGRICPGGRSCAVTLKAKARARMGSSNVVFITGLDASLAFAPCLKRKISGKAGPNRKHAHNEHLCLSGLLVCPAVLETLIPAVKPLYLKKLRASQSTKGGELN